MPEDQQQIECFWCGEEVPADTLDDNHYCDGCQEREHERQERTY